MPTNRLKILLGVLGGALIVGALSYPTYLNTKEIAKLESTPVVITRTVVVTPTIQPTATPAAVLKFTPRASSAAATKGVK